MTFYSPKPKFYWCFLIFFLSLILCQTNGFTQETTNQKPLIESISFTGNTSFSGDRLLKELDFGVGSTYNRPLILEGKYYISNFYTDNGFKYNTVTQESISDESTGGVKVIYHVNEGIKAYIGNIRITGNTKTADRVIQRELLLKTGDIYRRRNIYLSQSRLLSLNYFEEVHIEETKSPEGEKWVDIEVKVTERDTGRISFGGGYSTEEGIRGFARYRQSNLFGNGQQFSVGVKWSERGQSLSQSREIRMDFFEPHLFNTDIGLGMESYYRRENYDNYNLERIGGSIFATHQIIDEHTQGTLKYRIESDKTFNIANSIDSSVIALEGQSNLITMFSLNVTRDTRDNIAYPAHGSIYSMDFGVASEALGGDVNFMKTQLDGRWYIPLIEPKFVLALRSTFGYEEPFGGTNEIPIYERLFEGGADSVRGYKERYLGPKDADGYPAGGRVALVCNAELRFPIYKSFTGVAFYDAGNVWETFGTFDPTNLENSVGAGLRYQTPIGPIRFDYGIRIPKVDNGIFHISVGQTF